MEGFQDSSGLLIRSEYLTRQSEYQLLLNCWIIYLIEVSATPHPCIFFNFRRFCASLLDNNATLDALYTVVSSSVHVFLYDRCITV